MARLGMDPDEVERIGRELQNQANTLQNVVTAVDRAISQAQSAWEGSDSDKFRDVWVSQYKNTINNAVQSINDLGTTAIQNAADQRTVSS